MGQKRYVYPLNLLKENELVTFSSVRRRMMQTE